MAGQHKHFYMVNCGVLKEHLHRGLFLQCEWLTPGAAADTSPIPEDTVLMWARFGSETLLEAWESVPTVVPLPHPLEEGDASIEDDHMDRLKKELDLEVTVTTTTRPDPQNPGQTISQQARQFRDRRTNTVLQRNFTTREAMKRVAENRDRSFQFRVF